MLNFDLELKVEINSFLSNLFLVRVFHYNNKNETIIWGIWNLLSGELGWYKHKEENHIQLDYRRMKENERNELMLVRTNRTYTVLFVLFNKANLYLIAKGFEIWILK